MPETPPAQRHAAGWNCRGRRVDFSGGPVLVGILNVTPDSFFDGGRFGSAAAALEQAGLLLDEGAGLIDVGGQSTRPGYVEISSEEEIARVVPVVRDLVGQEVVLSIDTYKPAVARAALEAGAAILNDIYGLQGPGDLAKIAANYGAGVIAMHQDADFPNTREDVMASLLRYFDRTLAAADRAGLDLSQVVLDPGIGFHKTQEQNLEIMARLGELHALGCPLMLAASRKSVIAHVLGLPKEERLEGTLATTVAAVLQGVQLIRVHDVKPNLRAARMAAALASAHPRTL